MVTSGSDASSRHHRSERDVQTRMGVREQIEEFGRRVIRDHLPEQHRDFYEQIPFLMIGSIDRAGRPWALELRR